MKNKDGRPEWFRFWRRNRRQLDIEQLDLESRGIIFTNMMRYFDDGDMTNLLNMTPIEAMAFNILKVNIDDAYQDYAERAEINAENGKKGGRPKKTEKTESVNKNRNNPKKEVRS